jgi:hypothetical protein
MLTSNICWPKTETKTETKTSTKTKPFTTVLRSEPGGSTSSLPDHHQGFGYSSDSSARLKPKRAARPAQPYPCRADPARRRRLQNMHDVTLEERHMRKSEQISEFKTYLNERQRMTTATLSEIEQTGIEAALDRCRALAHRIRGDLRNKRPEHFVSVWSLADFQVSLERAASVLEQKSQRSVPKKSK